MKKHNKQEQEAEIPNFANHLIPSVYGAYAVSAFASDPATIRVGVYRLSRRDGESWIQEIAQAGRHDWFVMSGDECWRIYDGSGSQVAEFPEFSTVPGRLREEHRKPIDVDRKHLEAEAVIATGRNDLSCLAVFEDHTGANCADQTNLAALASLLIEVAKEEDCEHIYVIESQRWPCRVVGLFVALNQTSKEFIDRYLDYSPYVSRSEPLDFATHRHRLSRRLARLESVKIGEVLRAIYSKKRFEDSDGGVFIEGDDFVDAFLSASLKKRQMFIGVLLEMEGYKAEPGVPERLNLDRAGDRAETAVHLGMSILGLLSME